MGILDRILGRKAVEPAPAMSKRAAAIINATRNYESALADRLTASWRAGASSSPAAKTAPCGYRPRRKT